MWYIQINWMAVLLAAVSSFLLGGFWYSSVMFLKAWTKETEQTGRINRQGRHPILVFGFSFLFGLIASIALARHLGPNPPLEVALTESLIVGIAFVSTSFGINYLFTGHSLKLWAINAGYHVLQLLIFGLIFGMWH